MTRNKLIQGGCTYIRLQHEGESPEWRYFDTYSTVGPVISKIMEENYQKLLKEELPTKTLNIGETPEVDNTEGQLQITEDDIASLLKIIANDNIYYFKYRKELSNKIRNLNKPVETTKGQPTVWKLHCKNKENNYKAKIETYQGTAIEVALHVDKINNSNYSYFVVDFEKVG